MSALAVTFSQFQLVTEPDSSSYVVGYMTVNGVNKEIRIPYTNVQALATAVQQAQSAATLATNKATAADTSATASATSATNAATSASSAAASDASSGVQAGLATAQAALSGAYAQSSADSLAAALVAGSVATSSAGIANGASGWVAPNTTDGYIDFTYISKSAGGVVTIVSTVASATTVSYAKTVALVGAANDSDGWTAFVNSLIGSGSNPGTSKVQAFADPGSVTGLSSGNTVGFARGSSFTGRLSSSAASVRALAYGNGATPIGTGLSACPTFTLTSGETVVYQCTLTLPGDTKVKGNVVAGGKALKQVTSIALCRSTPGSCYVVNWAGTTSLCYVHTATDVAPGADGLTYQYTARLNNVDLTGGGNVVRGIAAQWNGHQDGSIRLAGEYNLVQFCDVSNGARHCMYVGANSVVEDCTFTDGWNDLEGSADGLVAYSDAITGKSFYGFRLAFKAVNSPNFVGFNAHGQNAADIYAKQYHYNYTFTGPMTGTVSMSAADSQLLDAVYSGVIGGVTVGKVGVVGQLLRGKGTINNLVTFQVAASATCAYHVLTVPKLTKGLYYSNVSSGDISLTITSDQVTISDAKDLPTTPNADLISIARGTLAGSGLVVGPALGCPLINGIYGGYGGTFTDNSDYNVWPIGTKFQIGATVYATLAAYQAATGKQPNSTTAAMPAATGSDDFNRTDEYLDVSPDWSLVAGTANTVGVRSNTLAALSSSVSLYARSALPSADHWAKWTIGSVPASGGPFVVVRATDQNNWIGVRWATGLISLFKDVGGTITLVANTSRTVTAGDVIMLAARGGKVFIYQNGEAILSGSYTISITDSILQTGVRVGIRTNGAALNPMLDDFSYGVL